MKKLLLLLLTLSLVVMLGACQQDTTEYATLTELEQLELDLLALEERFNNLVVVTGLNGITEYYENESTNELNTALITLSTDIIEVKGTLDKTKAPSYIVDEFEEYVSFEQLAKLLKAKYFGDATAVSGANGVEKFEVGQQAYIRYMFGMDTSYEELIARLILLTEELRLYQFYILSCPELYIHVYLFQNGVDTQFKLTIPLVTLTSDFITITPDGVYDGDYEIRLEAPSYNKALVQQYYDEFVTNETFAGYVLDYKE
jgi:hypothetical protein